MTYSDSSKTTSLTLSVLVMTFLIVLLVSAWTEPTVAPPGGNVDSPLNTGSTEQTKIGGLGLGDSSISGTPGFLKLINDAGDWLMGFDPSGNSWRLEWSGELLPAIQVGSDGNVGIGTLDITEKLNIGGDIKVGSAVTIKGDGSISTGLNADKLDDLNASDLMAAGGTSNMPLQGNIVFRDNASNFGISTIPLSLPRSECNVIITVCDYGNDPPLKLIVGADPISSTAASISNPGVSCGGTSPFVQCSISGSVVTGCQGTSLKCPSGYSCGFGTTGSCRVVCGNPDDCARSYYCAYTSGYGNCCPSSHPNYDPTSGNCVRDTNINTNKVGYCSVLSTILMTGFTDVTFADINGNPISTADYVSVSYSCPDL